MSSSIDLICAALRGEQPGWPDHLVVRRLLEEARAHGAIALLQQHTGALDWPRDARDAIREEAVALAMWEMQHEQVVARALAAFAAAGIEPVILKGTALAYSLYEDSALRTRSDTDLLVAPGTREQADCLLRSLGFERSVQAGGDVSSYQASYSAPNAHAHCFDLHWRINNSELLARLFTYEELRRDARPIPALSPHALGASPAHALLLASMHRGTHRQNPYYVDGVAHFDADRLVWLYDIHLLATTLTTAGWNQVTQLADCKGLRAVCLESLLSARARFHTAIPAQVLSALSHVRDEQPARYLAGSKLRQQCMDFFALQPASRRRWLREVLFPDRDYMLEKYAGARIRWLPWLYTRRATSGITRHVIRPRARS